MKDYALKIFRPSGTLRLAYTWTVANESDRTAAIKVFARVSQDHRAELWNGNTIIAWSGSQGPALSQENEKAVEANDGR